jgi:enediyne biosynthesis protein E4
VTNEFHGPPQVLVSDLAQRRPVRHLEVELVGTRSNRGGLGAVVTVIAGGHSQVEPMDGKSGYLSQSAMPLWFGLGDAEKVDRVEVAWPSGARQVIENPPLGKRLVVTEPAAEPRMAPAAAADRPPSGGSSPAGAPG